MYQIEFIVPLGEDEQLLDISELEADNLDQAKGHAELVLKNTYIAHNENTSGRVNYRIREKGGEIVYQHSLDA